MTVTRNVILDLTPLYLTGEASADTQALVLEYLTKDPELAQWMEGQRTGAFAPLHDAPPPHLETRTLRRTRRRIALQCWLFGIGCYFCALLLSFEYSTRRGHIVEAHFLARDHPVAATACLIVAVACWSAFATLRRRGL